MPKQWKRLAATATAAATITAEGIHPKRVGKPASNVQVMLIVASDGGAGQHIEE